ADWRSGNNRPSGSAGHELPHLSVVLRREHRTGDVSDAAIRLGEARGRVEQGRLVLYSFGERAGPHAPFGIGVPTPHPGASARRIHQNKVHFRFEIGEYWSFSFRCANLDVAGIGTLDAIIDRRETADVAVMGEDLAPVFNGRRKGKRLATRARAEVEQLFARLCACERRSHLRTLVLDFEPALLEGRLCGHRWMPAVRWKRNAQARRRPPR